MEGSRKRKEDSSIFLTDYVLIQVLKQSTVRTQEVESLYPPFSIGEESLIFRVKGVCDNTLV